MALHGAPHATLAVDEIAAVVNLPRDLARSLCGELRAALLLDTGDGNTVRLLPPSDGDASLLGELAELYVQDRVLLARVLSDIAMSRLRNLAARAFADAFVLRKKDRDDG